MARGAAPLYPKEISLMSGVDGPAASPGRFDSALEKAACAPSEVPGDAAQLGEAFRPAPPAPPAPAEALAGAGRHGAGGALLSTSGGPGGQPGPPRVYQPRLPMEMHPAHIQVPPYAGAGCRPEHYAPSAQRPRPRETSDSFQMARQVAALSSRAEAVPGGLFRRGAPHAGAAGPL
ncbi:unnamed protein product [Prorocentrum cordatum]|uniref:Uncharacterized protein n=1 Tax=Prorocentrum cordatum TaxID=2364126 RepID=A0ABN9UX49_9DINO|nr:unnamed protein product [Polarella glacialis]